MAIHRPRHFQKKRQAAATPSVAGFDGSTTISPVNPTAVSSLVIDSDPIVSQSASAPGIVSTGVTLHTSNVATISSAVPTATEAQSAASSASSKGLPTSTVVGAAVGAVAILLLALLALCYTRSRDKALKRVPASAAFRNINANIARRLSGREAWSRLPEDKRGPNGGGAPGDEWTGMSDMRQAPSPNSSAPFRMGEKPPQLHVPPPVSPLNAFKFPSPTHSPTLKHQASFDSYHPGLAEELAQPQRLYVRENHRDENNPNSWGGDTLRDSSFLSLKSVSGVPAGHADALAAIPDPEPYHPRPRDMSSWNPDAFAEAGVDEPPTPAALDDASAFHNPFAEPADPESAAIRNPFADAQDVSHRHRHARSNSASSNTSDTHDTRQSAGTMALQMMHGTPTHEPAERERELRAMKNLIAALDHPAPPSTIGSTISSSVGASLRPSGKSRVSAMSAMSAQSDYSQYEESSVASFPLPPVPGNARGALR